MKMESLKRVSITQEMIDLFVPGCPINNPAVYALKEQGFPEAKEILWHGDEIYVDGMLVVPTAAFVAWMNAWSKSTSVKPSILGYTIYDQPRSSGR